ncbi:MAG: glutamate ABC transporter substrate-binding protein [Acidimicrobiales bacterium]
MPAGGKLHRPGRLMVLWAVLALLGWGCGGEDGGSAPPATGRPPATADPALPSFAAGTTMRALQERGRLVVGTKFDQPLFGGRNPVTGAVEGFDVEIAKLMARGIFGDNIDGKVQFVETVSRDRESAIVDGRVDIVVATYSITAERRRLVDFAGPYYMAGQDILVRRDEASILRVDDLNGRRVCAVEGSTSLEVIRARAPRADVSITYDRYSQCADALLAGRVDAVTTDNTILLGIVKEHPGQLKLVNDPFTVEPYGIGLRRGDTAFRSFLNDRLEHTFANGDWKRAFEATVGHAGEPAPRPPRIERS